MSTRHALFCAIAALILLSAPGISLAAHTRLTQSQPAEIQAQSKIISRVGDEITVYNEPSLVEASPAIAYNDIRHEYLAVWYNDRPGNDDIRARRIAQDGRLLGGPFYISAAGDGIDRRYPRVAFNIKSDQYLVVWEHQDISSGYSIHGRRVSGDGQVLDASDLIIRSAGINLYTPAKPAVAYAYTSNKYLVVWQETWHPLPISTSIVGQVVLDSGALDGGNITVSQDPGGYFRTNPDLAYNIGRNEYLVVWEQLDPAPDPDIIDLYSRRVTGEGAPLPPESTNLTHFTTSTTAPAVASLPTQPDGLYLVLYELHYKPDDWDINGLLISSDNIPQVSIDIAKSYSHELQPSLTASPNRGLFLATWKQVDNPSFIFSFIANALITPSAQVLDYRLDLYNLRANHPRTAAGWLGDYMVVYEDTPLTADNGIYGHLIGNRAYLPWTMKNH